MRDLASRMADLGTETAFDVLARARALEALGRRILHLEIGEPDFPTPEHIVEAGVRALRDGATRYGPPPGLPSLRAAVCEHISATRGVEATPDEVVVTPGAKPILFFAILATIGPGDEIFARISYDGPHTSIAALPGMRSRTVLADGFSKAYAMTGWRLGFGIFPQRLVEPVTRLQINSNSCTAAFVQLAGVEALRG